MVLAFYIDDRSVVLRPGYTPGRPGRCHDGDGQKTVGLRMLLSKKKKRKKKLDNFGLQCTVYMS